MDPYMSEIACINRLVNWYEKYGKIIVAFDFDDTIFDHHKKGHTYDTVINLLKECQQLGFTLILFTSNEGQKLKNCIKYCHELGFKKYYVNHSPINPKERKPYYNILLDDKSGLGQSYSILTRTIKIIKRLNKNRTKVKGE